MSDSHLDDNHHVVLDLIYDSVIANAEAERSSLPL